MNAIGFIVVELTITLRSTRYYQHQQNQLMLVILVNLFVAGLASSAVAAFSSVAPRRTPSVATAASPNPKKIFASHFDKKKFATDTALLTYLEINGWLLSIGGVTILIDPILEGALDFGIPAIYSASKKSLPSTGLCESLPPIDCLLITQGLDDHAHERTLKKLAMLDESVPIVAPPSARNALEKSGFGSGDNIRYVRPGDDTVVNQRNNGNKSDTDRGVTIRATAGALVGPPWQARENGYIIRSSSSKGPSVYIEPHVEYNIKELKREAPVDVVITPVSGQGLPAFELVHGPNDALQLVQILRPKYVVPMPNGEIDAEGLVSPLVQSVGTPEEFRRMLERLQRHGESKTQIMNTIPGEGILLGK